MEVVVVGGGAIGLSVALRLALSKVRVTVIERSKLGAEASSAAAGILGAQAEVNQPGPLFDLCLQSRGLYPDFLAELRTLSAVDVEYVPSGLLRVASTEEEAEGFKSTLKWHLSRGLRAELLSSAQARALAPMLSEKIVGALHFPDDHQIDNRRLLKALGEATAKLGVRTKFGTVESVLEVSGKAKGVRVNGEWVPADATVIAAGAWSSQLQGAGLKSHDLKPIRGQMAQLLLEGDRPRQVLFSSRGYLVPRKDGRLLAGSTMEDVGFVKRVTPGGLGTILAMTLELCPKLEGAPVVDCWSGLRPATADGLPILGKGHLEGLFFATGHFRNGILLTPATAKLVAELVLTQKPSLELHPFRFDRL